MISAELSSTQVGVLAENLVINALMLSSNGRFAPFRPVADDDGIDLLLYDKNSGRVVPLQVKARTRTLKKPRSSERGNVVHFQVRRQAIRHFGMARLLAILLREDATSIDAAWLIPMGQLATLARQSRDNLVIRPSISARSKDKCRPYYLASIDALVSKLTREFEQWDGSLPTMSVLR
jgi:hypothetical protein